MLARVSESRRILGVGRTPKHQRDDAATATHWMSPSSFSSMATPLRTCRLAAIAVPISTRVLAQSEDVPRPVADHHAHLRSIANWQLVNERLPVVKLPDHLDQVLRDF